MKLIAKFFLLMLLSQQVYAGVGLWLFENRIKLQFDVEQLSHQELHNKTNQENTLLFDIRRAEEYQQSRIKGGIQVDPDMKAEDFIAKYGDKMNKKELIFYCSVGYRSSVFIKRIEKQAQAMGVKKMYNLTGGIFRWYNEHLQVVNNQGDTDDIHPNEESWAHLIEPRVSKSHD
jgi:rhodanese-related sulfurtransferase